MPRAPHEHRLTQVKHPWTEAQDERINRTVKEATVKRFYYDTHEPLRNHLADFINAYNYTRRLKTLKGLSSYQSSKLNSHLIHNHTALNHTTNQRDHTARVCPFANGQPAGALGYSRAPRTVIGADADGKIYLISVDGSELDLVQAGGPVGASENELLAIAQFLGLINAANLDGGGRSTSMVVEGKVLSHDTERHLQSPYDDDRRVGDAVLVIDDQP